LRRSFHGAAVRAGRLDIRGLPVSLLRNENLARALFGQVPLEEAVMGFGRGALLWLLGVPIPVIILLALFWHH
jgi:hypothetical protein